MICVQKELHRTSCLSRTGGNTTSPSPSQGPPSPGYCYYGRVDIAGNDLDCGQTEYDGTPRPYCELRDLPYVEASCNLNDQCQAWTYDGYRAILKTAKGPMTYREGWSVFA
ncbi:hypothetical protein DUNSADRAFT_7663 [Dunaliella salina]|uniref:Uncharacterized protein n=1 Tax=Dunaliella salina TaxID=3046 RepID=A0ABQ7H674_DUNSA|nr:hypothetical protein DUNSADRAFT_7663 [Dunaliella salina]|eukprot:KAF5842349.1 hypothetical protein DUNSADRAFT_7663 [Dunaliella salina]